MKFLKHAWGPIALAICVFAATYAILLENAQVVRENHKLKSDQAKALDAEYNAGFIAGAEDMYKVCNGR